MSSLKYKDANGVWRKVGLGRNVSSVNGKYGDVVITAAELGAAPNELTDETASALGLNNGASVDSGLKEIANSFVNGKAYFWKRRIFAYAEQLGEISARNFWGQGLSGTKYYYDEIIISDTGEITFGAATGSITTTSVSSSDVSKAQALKGKYFEAANGDICYMPEDATNPYWNSGIYVYAQTVTAELTQGEWFILQDTDENAYAEGIYDGFETVACGKVEDAVFFGVKIETGSYTGTGTSGSSNPTMLTFSNAPSAVMIFKTGMYATNVGKGGIYTFLTGADNSATDFAVLGIDMNSIETSYQSGSLSYDTSNTSGTKIKKSEDGKTLYMYHPNYAASQMNATMVYYYITIA
jgi:hypothetical protein